MSWYSSARRGVCLPYSAKRGKVRFFDASGATVVLVDKVAILDNNDQIVAGVVFPVPVEIACDVIGWEVDTANHGSRGARPASVGRVQVVIAPRSRPTVGGGTVRGDV